VPLIPKHSLSGRVEEENRANPGLCGQRLLKQRWCACYVYHVMWSGVYSWGRITVLCRCGLLLQE